MQHIKEILKKLDLTDKEINIYLACLKLGTTASSGITYIIDLPQSTIKYTLELLVKKKLLTKSKKGITTLFTAEHPSKLKNLLIIKKNEIENTEKHIENIMGDLIGIYNPYIKLPKVSFFEGINSYIDLFEDVLKSGEKEIYMIANTQTKQKTHNKSKELIEYEKNIFLKERVKRGIFMNLITTKKDFGLEIKNTDKEYLRKTKFLPENFGNIENIIIYGDKVLLMTDDSPMVGIFIKDKNLKESFISIFKFIWNHTENNPL